MRRLRALLAIAAILAVPCGTAFARTGDDTPRGPRASDTASVDAILAAAYDAISGEAGAPRDWDRFRSLFVPGARFITATPDDKGVSTARMYDTDAFVTNFEGYVKTQGFFERGVANRAERYGNIAHVFSTYESRHAASDPKPFARGVNSFQLMFDGTRWWIVTIYWQQESAKFPIPEKYLKNG